MPVDDLTAPVGGVLSVRAGESTDVHGRCARGEDVDDECVYYDASVSC